MKNIQTKYKLNFKTMKKGLLTLLAASIVFVGCQNYDDQFDDLNAQISALKSQVDGLSSLSGQVASLSGTISGLQAGVNAAQAAASSASAAAGAIDLTGLSSSLATLQAEVDAVQASLATAATASAVTALQAEVAAIQADVDDLLATSNVYTNNLEVTTPSQLDAAVALGNNINIVNGTVNISQTATMDATKLQGVIDKIFTTTGSYTYTTSAASNTAMTFDKLTSTGDLTLTVNGPISAKALITAGTITLNTTYTSSVTSVNMDSLTTVTDITTGSSADTVNFSSATDVQLGALAVYTDALSITTKKGATLDIGSLDDLNTAGTAVDMSLTVNGPGAVTISGWDDSYDGTITATNVGTLTTTGYEGNITIGDGVENVVITGAVKVALSSADDLETVDITNKLFDDPNKSATVKAPAAYGGYGRETSLSFSSTSLTTVKLNGYYINVTSSGNGNLATVDIDATIGGTLNLTNNDNLTSLDVTGSEIAHVTFTGNDGITAPVFDHTTELNYNGATADLEDVDVTITDNLAMTTLTWGADKVEDLTVTGNDALTTVNFAGLAGVGADADGTPTLSVYDNALTASAANDTVDGLATGTQYSIDGTNDASDEGAFTTASGLGTLKTYMTAVKATARASAAVNFDIVQSHTIATDAGATGETEGVQNSGNVQTFEANGGTTSSPKSNWVGLVYADTKSTYTSSTSNPTAVPEQAQRRAFVLDVSDLTATTSTMNLQISDGSALVPVLHNGSAYTSALAAGTKTNLNLLINTLKTGSAVSRAADLGATLDVYKGANSTAPKVVFATSATSASGGNGEAYTDAQIAALYGGNGTLNSVVTTYDVFTYTIGGNSVTASITLSGATSATGSAATAAVADALASAWNTKYGTGGTSANLSFWGLANGSTTSGTLLAVAQKSEQAGSRPYGQSVAISHARATAAQASLATSGTITNTFMDWTIGTVADSSDNTADATDIIISLEEVTEGAINGANATMNINNGITPLVELNTAKTYNGTASVTTNATIFPSDAGMYGAISGGGAGDARDDETVNEGVDVTTTSGSLRATFTRLHWLS